MMREYSTSQSVKPKTSITWVQTSRSDRRRDDVSWSPRAARRDGLGIAPGPIPRRVAGERRPNWYYAFPSVSLPSSKS